MLAYKAEEHQWKSFLLLIVVCIKIIVTLGVTITTKQLIIMTQFEEKIYDIVKKESLTQEKRWSPTSFIMKSYLYSTLIQVTLEQVEMALGKLLFEGKIQMKYNDKLGEVFHINE